MLSKTYQKTICFGCTRVDIYVMDRCFLHRFVLDSHCMSRSSQHAIWQSIWQRKVFQGKNGARKNRQCLRNEALILLVDCRQINFKWPRGINSGRRFIVKYFVGVYKKPIHNLTVKKASIVCPISYFGISVQSPACVILQREFEYISFNY